MTCIGSPGLGKIRDTLQGREVRFRPLNPFDTAITHIPTAVLVGEKNKSQGRQFSSGKKRKHAASYAGSV